MKPVVFTVHALVAMAARGIERELALRTVAEPEWTGPDARHKGRTNSFRRFDAFGGHALRVVHEESAEMVEIITVFPDRKARPKS